MNDKNIISILLNNGLSWNRVNEQPCVHTFYGQFYINLCQWKSDGVDTVSIDVDNIESGRSDIVNMDVSAGDSNYERLVSIYKRAIENAHNIAA